MSGAKTQTVTLTSNAAGELRPPPEVFMSLTPVAPQQLGGLSGAGSPLGGTATLTSGGGAIQKQQMVQIQTGPPPGPSASATPLAPTTIQLPQHPLPVQAVAGVTTANGQPAVTVTTVDIQSQLQSLQPIPPQAVTVVNSVVPPAAVTGGLVTVAGGKGEGDVRKTLSIGYYWHFVGFALMRLFSPVLQSRRSGKRARRRPPLPPPPTASWPASAPSSPA